MKIYCIWLLKWSEETKKWRKNRKLKEKNGKYNLMIDKILSVSHSLINGILEHKSIRINSI
jgi:hypothetical protein